MFIRVQICSCVFHVVGFHAFVKKMCHSQQKITCFVHAVDFLAIYINCLYVFRRMCVYKCVHVCVYVRVYVVVCVNCMHAFYLLMYIASLT